MVRRTLLIAVAVACGPSPARAAEPPPAGPPWARQLAEAQKTALDRGTPIFVYFTKKYCPHCAPVEKDTLPSPTLKPAYDKAAWLYVNRNFDGSALDRVAERIEARFGVSSYPHLLLVHPETLEIIAELGRSPEQVVKGLEKAKVTVTDAKAAAERLRKAEERLTKLEKTPTAAAAAQHLTDEDPGVRMAALRLLGQKNPKAVTAKAAELLSTPNDVFRYEVCEVLARAGDTSAASALEAIVTKPTNSLNPNVMRIRAVEALAKCGREESVAVIAEFATKGDALNGLTGEAVDTLAAIAARLPKTKPAVKEALIGSYPPAGGSSAEAQLRDALARKVHQHLTTLTGRKVPFPNVYDDAARTKLMKSW